VPEKKYGMEIPVCCQEELCHTELNGWRQAKAQIHRQKNEEIIIMKLGRGVIR
jgi:hypothetical protein